MPQSTNYNRECEACGYKTNVSSGWCRHIKTKKHIKLLEDRTSLLEAKVELLTLQLANTTIHNTTNNTTNIVDASNNVIINIFVPNPNAVDLNSIILPHTRELAKYKITPTIAIQKAVLGLDDKKPILYRNNSLYVKQDGWKKDAEAEKQLDKYCRDTQHRLICELNDMDMNDEFFCEASELVYQDLDKDSVLHKVKSKLIK